MWLRSEIDAGLRGFVEQLDGLHGHEQVPNLDWTTVELTAHLASLPAVYRRQHDIGEAFSPPSDWARFSVEQRNGITTDDLAALSELLRAEMATFLDAVDDPDDTRWLYGCSTTDRNVAGAMLAELIIHGQDLGRLTGTEPVFTPDQAAAALPNTMAIVPSFVVRERASGIAGTYHLGFRGHGDWTFQISAEGDLAVEPGRPARADARLSADPAAFLLVSLGRANQFVTALTGKMVAYGRRPWRLLALGKISVDGV